MTNHPSAGSNNPPNERVPSVPSDRYELMGLLGSGGMGTVLKARHAQLNKLVAIKVLNMELIQDRSSLSRFETEARAGGQLSHPNLVAVFDFGYTVDGEPFFVMEYVEGASLGQLVKKFGRCSNEDFIEVFGQALKALNYIHRKNVIHRDIKSSNIMLQVIEGDRYIKLLDFGIAKVLADSGVTMQQLTATGEAIGSPLYMSPEQCRGSTVDARADIYSLGCVMYECFAGNPPFRGENAMQTIQMHLNAAPSPLAALCRSEQELQIASLIHKCILKNPDDRFQSAGELAGYLEEVKHVGTQVSAIQRPVPTSGSGMGNRWKKGRGTSTDNPVFPKQEAGQNARPTGIQASGLHKALRPGAFNAGAPESAGSPPGAVPGQNMPGRPHLQGGQPGNMASAPMAAGLSQTFKTGGIDQGNLPMGAGQSQAMDGQNPTEADDPGKPQANSGLWHMHNVAGQQSMASRNHYEAERHFLQAVELAEQFAPGDLRLPQTLNKFANCLKVQGRYQDAEQTYLKALKIMEASVGPTDRELVLFLENYANLLRICDREQEAAKLDKRIQAILKI